MSRRPTIEPELSEDGELIAREPSSAVGMSKDGEKASMLMEVLKGADDIKGMITESQVSSPDGEVTSARSSILMQRVALVFADPDNGGTLQEKLLKAGCPPELYYQMREMPEFKTVLHKAINDYIILPRIGPIMVAMSNAAMIGDVRAAGRCLEFARMLEGTDIDAMADDIARIQDKDAYAREVFQTLKDVRRLADDLELTDEQKSKQEVARKAVTKHKPVKRKPKIDHGKLHG